MVESSQPSGFGKQLRADGSDASFGKTHEGGVTQLCAPVGFVLLVDGTHWEIGCLQPLAQYNLYEVGSAHFHRGGYGVECILSGRLQGHAGNTPKHQRRATKNDLQIRA